jgi:hypothetical protein
MVIIMTGERFNFETGHSESVYFADPTAQTAAPTNGMKITYTDEHSVTIQLDEPITPSIEGGESGWAGFPSIGFITIGMPTEQVKDEPEYPPIALFDNSDLRGLEAPRRIAGSDLTAPRTHVTPDQPIDDDADPTAIWISSYIPGITDGDIGKAYIRMDEMFGHHNQRGTADK